MTVQVESASRTPSPSGLQVWSGHPMDSGRILLSMMALAQRSDRSSGAQSGCILSRPILRTLLSALHYRDESVMMHSRRVALLAVGMAQQLGWEGRHLRVLEVAALLHDVGKIGIADSILSKPGRLSPDEAEYISLHHNTATDLLQACRVDKEVIEIVMQSHTYYEGALDGSRSVGAGVHQGARILAVADAYDSLVNRQSYRDAKDHASAMTLLREQSGTRFDGSVVAALDRWIQADGLSLVMNRADVTVSVQQNTALNSEVEREATTLCHIFSYLYVLESLYHGFFIVDADLRFTVWSRGAEQLFGKSASSVIDQPWTPQLVDYFDEHGIPITTENSPLMQVMRTSRPCCRQLQLRGANGDMMPIEVQTMPLIDEAGRLHGIAEIFRDTSRSKQNSGHYRELKIAASRDALTGVVNRGELETQLAKLLSDFHAVEDSKAFSAIFLDIDHFKKINDTYGHGVGDRVLVTVAKLLQDETYSGELVARYGGEEFVVLCPATDLAQAVHRADRLRKAVADATIDCTDNLSITASFGVTEAVQGDSIESVFRRADNALYTAKQSGRNRVCYETADASEQEADAESSTQIESAGSKPFEFRATIRACVQSQMIVYKLAGFVEDSQATLLEVEEAAVRLQVGTPSLLRRWGRSPARQPVRIEMNFGEVDTTRHVSERVLINVVIRPVGRAGYPETFQMRARYVFENLRSYLVAD